MLANGADEEGEDESPVGDQVHAEERREVVSNRSVDRNVLHVTDPV